MMKKPLIILYKTPFGQYFYETNRNEVVSVSENMYQYLRALLYDIEFEDLDITEKTKAEYIELQECGYLSPPVVQEVKHPLTGELEKILDRKVDKVTLQITQNCNLRCSYCIYSEDSNLGQRSHSANIMSLDTAKKALNFYKEHSIDSEMASITFYGGEPLIEFQRMKEIVSYAEQIFEGKEILFGITTNATLLNEEVIDFLLEHKFNITISIDGPQKVQDKNRKFKGGQGSYDIVIKNVSLLHDKNPDLMKNVTISMVIDPEQDYSELVTLFQLPILEDVNLTYTMVEKDAEILPPSNDYLTKYQYDLFLAYVEYFRSDDKKYASKLVKRDLDAFKSGMSRFKTNILSQMAAPGGPCVPGKMRLFVNSFGDLYPCERVNEDCCMKIGTLENGFDYNQINAVLNIGQLTADKCKKCWAFQQCTICAKRADEEGIISVPKKNTACNSSMATAYDTIVNKVLVYENDVHMRKMAKIKKEVNT